MFNLRCTRDNPPAKISVVALRQVAGCFFVLLLQAIASCFFASQCLAQETNWPQPAGPNSNWQVEGEPTLKWSATRQENIKWRSPLPEAGMSGVAVWGKRCFTTVHVPIETEKEKLGVKDIIGLCFDTKSGKKLWEVNLPGTSQISLAGGFTDGTVFSPITDGNHVWFFNRCGSMGCYDMDGNEVWLRKWTPRFKHNNRQAEPFLVGDALLYVEVGNKEVGAKLQKWLAPGVKNPKMQLPPGTDEREAWTFVHGISKETGKVLWSENAGTSIHTTPVVMATEDGVLLSHARGGPHQAMEKPYGHSLTSIVNAGKPTTLWSTELPKYDPSFSCHLDEEHVYGFHVGEHIVMSRATGEVLRRQALYTDATVWKHAAQAKNASDVWIHPKRKETWVRQEHVAVRAGKGHPNTNQANLVVGKWHWFLSHNVHYLGRVHTDSGEVEYLELPSQLVASNANRADDLWLWGKQKRNKPTNAQGFAVGDKGHNGTGWGHISAASPIRVGKYLLLPVVTGTVYVIDLTVKDLTPAAIVSVNDLGPGDETWTLSALSYAAGDLYARTMREIICIGE